VKPRRKRSRTPGTCHSLRAFMKEAVLKPRKRVERCPIDDETEAQKLSENTTYFERLTPGRCWDLDLN